MVEGGVFQDRAAITIIIRFDTLFWSQCNVRTTRAAGGIEQLFHLFPAKTEDKLNSKLTGLVSRVRLQHLGLPIELSSFPRQKRSRAAGIFQRRHFYRVGQK